MGELHELLRPVWGAEKWILEGWNTINADEKALIKTRMEHLFQHGLPFELHHDKNLYIYTFSLLAQLEVLAIQVPMRFEEHMHTLEFKQQMRKQLLDEIFHGMVFTKIVYLLCAPYSYPPEYNEHIESLCNFIRNEECPKVGVVLLNLVAEGWIEEIFKSLYEQNIAKEVFSVILQDEHRHVCEADLYRTIGMPNKELLEKKLATMEELLLTSLSLQSKYGMSIYALLGFSAAQQFIQALNAKHIQQLKKIDLQPSKQWNILFQIAYEAFNKIEEPHEVEMSSIRKYFMTQWNGTGDPTMVSQFNLDVSLLSFFEKKFPPETLTTLMMQSVSHVLTLDDSYRNFMNHTKLCQSEHAYVSIVVKLPECKDHIGSIVFKNCHQLSLPELSKRIRDRLQMMVYCYQKRLELEVKYPFLKQKLDALLYEHAYDIYPYPMMGSFMVSISSIGFCGYSQAVSPLRKHESLKITLLSVERKPVWNEESNSFEARDLLPVSISADHRIFDGNLPIPRTLQTAFQKMFQKMQKDISVNRHSLETPKANLRPIIDKMIKENLDMTYAALASLQNVWFDFISVDELFDMVSRKLAKRRFESFPC